MFLGHYGLALAAKRTAPRTSLGVLFFAAQFLDELWPLLLLAGVEQVRIVPGIMAATPLEFVHYPWSHSLLLAVTWGLLTGFAYFFVRRYKHGAYVVGGLVVSHWFLDAPMHRPDLPLWPGSAQMIGAGLWDFVAITMAVEFGLLALGVVVYLRGTRARDRIGSWGLYALIGTLVLAFASSFAGPPPNERALAYGALALWLFIPWAHWVDRHRTHELSSG
jgi:hypothetical protein